MLNRFKTVTKARFKKTDFNSFLFFLFFAIVIWIFVQFSKQYSEVIEIPVEYVNVPPDKLLLNNPESLQLRVEENGFTVAWFSLFAPTITIDLAQAHVADGNLVYDLIENRAQLQSQLELDMDDNQFLKEVLTVNFEQKQEKKLPVIFRSNIEYAAGYSAVSDLQFTPDSIMVSGPDNVLDTLSRLLTEPLSLAKVKNDREGAVYLDTTALPNVTFYNNKVEYSLDVEKFTEGKVQVPIEIMNVPRGLNVVIFPKEVVLFYQVNLKEFNKVTASDFRVVVDFNEVRGEQDFLIPQVIKKPDFTSNLRLNEKRIQFIIKK
ncbi:YbbR-like domain-containing protein [Salinimicrobium sp. MT39]|uniref:YbbR-like domain-containing protein n=1 Tax=Salinimicrobium profundisediminis TaxID=2994553 RepID=A0A9X3I048_9FLAO|nr:YbbR-like domain-containing protein [Salinimicrobium profundisediminis]MCX2837635.1 YbbR-like domain-containing protein [Salinimicrobium profundisediminis]